MPMSSVADRLLPRLYVFGVFELHGDGTLRVDDKRVHLPPKELQVLHLLLASAGTLISKDLLLEHVWPRCDIGEESLTRCIYVLRRAFGAHKGYIQTVYGKGYRLTCKVEAHVMPCPVDGAAAASLGRVVDRYQAQLALDDHNPSLWCALAGALISQALAAQAPCQLLLRQAERALERALLLQPARQPCSEAMA